MTNAQHLRESIGLSLRQLESEYGAWARLRGKRVYDHSTFQKLEQGSGSVTTLKSVAAFYTDRLSRAVTIDELLADAPAPEKATA